MIRIFIACYFLSGCPSEEHELEPVIVPSEFSDEDAQQALEDSTPKDDLMELDEGVDYD